MNNDANMSDLASAANIVNGKLSRIGRTQWGANEATALVTILRTLAAINADITSKMDADLHDPEPVLQPVSKPLSAALTAFEMKQAAE